MWGRFTTKIPSRGMSSQASFIDYAIPDTVTLLEKEAFMGNHHIKRVYIPKSVVTIERDAFKGCECLEIFCEGEPQEGWVSGVGKDIERYSVVTPEDDAFNFHRSAGSFTSTTVEREVVRDRNWNPDGRPVHTNVPRKVCDEWDLFNIMYLVMIYRANNPYNEMTLRAIKELADECRELQGVKVLSTLDVFENPYYAKRLGYTNLPSIYDSDDQKTVYEPEAGLTYDELKKGLENAFRKALCIE